MNTRFLGILVTVGLSFSAFANAGSPFDIASDDSLVVDNFADGDYTSNFGKWAFANDNGDGGGSTVKTSIVDATTNIGPAKALKLDYTLSKKKLEYSPFVEAQVALSGDGSAVDLSKCTEIRYEYYVGGPRFHYFRVMGDTNVVNVAYNYHYVTVYGNAEWQTASVKWGELRQATGWGNRANIEDVRKNAVGFSWQIQGNDGESGSLQIANVRCLNLPTYTVRFYRGKVLLDSAEYTKGELPSYHGDYELGSEKYSYNIVGWKPAITEVTANVDYQAVLDSSIRSYDVEFYDADGYRLTRQRLEYGTVPSYVGMNPVKLPSVGYTYTFKGWGKQICEEVEQTYCYDDGEFCDTWTDYVCRVEYTKELSPVNGDVEYYPVYDSTVNSYTVKFADYDGKVLSEKRYAYGTKVKDIAKPKDPSRAKADNLLYTFSGWTPDISEVEGNAVYVATYSVRKVENNDTTSVDLYTVVFANGDSILQTGEYAYGDMPEYKGKIPTKDSTVDVVYTFDDWRNASEWYEGIRKVDENTVYVAKFNEEYRKYWIVFLDEDGTLLDSVQYEYGRTIDAYDIKTRSYENGYEHEYYGWEPALQRVTGRAVYKAVYSAYRVIFAYDDGTWYTNRWVSKGQIPECKSCSPRKSPTKDVSYKFVGWNKELGPVTDTVTYTAVFAAEPLPKATAVNIAVGDSWLIDDFEDGDEISLQGGTWFTYDDHDAIQKDGKPYNSQISKMVAVNGKDGNVMSILFKRECDEDDKGDSEYYYMWDKCDGWIGAGVTLAEDGNAVDLSKCNAIQYDYRGGAHFFRIESTYDKDYNHLEKFFAATDKWTTATVYRSEFMEGTVNAELAFSHATQIVWNNMIGEGTLELDNIKCLNKPSYTVKFYDGQTLLDSAVFAQGETPKYRGEKSEWSLADERGYEDEQYEYVFTGWSPEIKPATANVDYQILLKKELRKYRICFKGKGIDYDCHEEEYGKTPKYGSSLTREPDESCSKYVFDKWYSYEYHYDMETETVYGLQPVTDERTYYGEFTCTEPVTFVITFLNDNGDTLSSKKYPYGEYVNYFEPSKKSTEKYDYEFDGWKPDFDPWDSRVYENKTYTAQYSTSIRQYDVWFVDADNRTVEVDGEWSIEYPYGTSISRIRMPTEMPEKYGDDDVQYVFDGWTPTVSSSGRVLSDKDSVTTNVVFVPNYKHKYGARFVDYDGSTIEVDGQGVQFYLEGALLSNIVLPKENPTRDSAVVCREECKKVGYEFAGWLPTIDPKGTVTGPMTFKAAYKSSAKTFTVVFMNGNEILYEDELAEGDSAVYKGWRSPYKSNTEEFSYTWDENDGWEPKLDTVKGPVVYQAKFTATRKQYEVAFETFDGKEISRKTYDYGAKITNVPTKAQFIAGITGDYIYSDEWCQVYYWTDYKDDNKDDKPVEVKVRNVYCDGKTELPLASENVIYTPSIQYKVAFVNDTDTLWNTWSHYGNDLSWIADDIARHNSYRIKKPSSVQYNYTWNGKWDKEVTRVTGSAIYTPVFDSTLRKYKVTFVDEDGTVLKEATAYDYGTLVNSIVLPKAPTKKATVDTTYAFAGWSLDKVTGDTTYVASYKASPRKYLVTFVGEDGKTVVDSARYVYETEASAIKVPKAPAKEGFKFSGWTPEVVAVTKNATYKATYIENTKFMVTWRNEDGTLLKQDVYSEGETPKYTGTTPKKKASVDSTFTFSAWTPAPAAVTKDAEYKATYKSSVRRYKVKFANADGTILDSAVYAYGTLAEKIKVPEVPAKAPTAYYVYTFVGWTPAIEDVTGDVTYTALIGNQRRTYTVTFKSDDETVYEKEYYYNEVASLDWGPSKSTPECSYDFDKWVRKVGTSDTVKADMEYVATYSSKCNVRYYEVSIYDPIRDDGIKDYFKYGTKVSELPKVNVADTTIGDCSYKFIGWTPELADVTSTADYDAVYEKTCKVQYTVTWLNADGKQLEKKKYNAGEKPVYDGATPTKDSSAQFTYRFIGWTPTVVALTKDATYKAKYDSTYRKYAVTFKDSLKHKGFVDGEMTAIYRYGTKASAIQVPTIADTVIGKCTYAFSKWDKTIADVTADVTYEAQFTVTCEQPPVSSSSVVKSSSSVATSSSSVKPTSSSVAKSSSSVKPASSSVAKSSSSVKPASSSVAKSSSSVKPASSSVAKSSSSVKPASSAVVKSSSSVKPASSSVVKSSSSVKPASSAVAKSSSSVKVTSSATAKSSSAAKPKSSSSVKVTSSATAKSSSGAKPKSSSATAKSSSSKKTSSSSKKSNVVVDNLNNFMKFGFENNTLTVSLAIPSMVQVHVFDMKGQLQEEYSEYVSGTRAFELDRLHRGNYIVRVTSNSMQKTSRIMIK